MVPRLKKKVEPGSLLSEFDLHINKYLAKYIILSMDDFEFEAYCLFDSTGLFSQGEIVSIFHDEIESSDRFIWNVEHKPIKL